MKNRNICPKCNSNNIVCVNGGIGSDGAGNIVMVGRTVFSAVPIDRYICCDCGFTEEWIDQSYLSKIKEKYSK